MKTWEKVQAASKRHKNHLVTGSAWCRPDIKTGLTNVWADVTCIECCLKAKEGLEKLIKPIPVGWPLMRRLQELLPSIDTTET